MPTVSTSSGTDGSNPAPSSGESIANSTSVTGPTGGLMRSAAGAPVRKLLFVEALGHTRVPFAGYRADHRAGVELAAIDAHRAAEAAADLERRLDSRSLRGILNRGPTHLFDRFDHRVEALACGVIFGGFV